MRSEFESQISFPAAEFKNAWSLSEHIIDKLLVFLAKEDLKKLRIMPNLRVLSVLPDLAPVA
jgi:hypothetical protein